MAGTTTQSPRDVDGHEGRMTRTATPRLLRRLNAQRVLDALRDGGTQRVTELVARTGLSRPTVDAVADDLVRLGWVAELAEQTPRRGRPARALAFRADAGYVAAIDIGEVKVRAAVADLRGQVVAERLHEFDADDRLPEIRSVARATLKDAGVSRARGAAGSPPHAAGASGAPGAAGSPPPAAPRGHDVTHRRLLAACVSCTGAMDATRGRIIFSDALPHGFNLAGALQRTLAAPVVIENDCNLAVIGERWQGVARGTDDVICVLGGERIGAGIVVGGKLLRGHAGAAGELAFLDAYAHEQQGRGIAQLVGVLAGQTPEAVFEAARAGDPTALHAVERAANWAGLAIVAMAQVVNPELVVIGGGVAGAGEVLLDPLRRLVEERVPIPPRIEASSLGARGPLVGAIRHALDHLEPRLLDGLDEAA
jgi:predicted NBD/HSP70 family sugar kinase